MERKQTSILNSSFPAEKNSARRRLTLLTGLCLVCGSILLGACGVISASVSLVAMVAEVEQLVQETDAPEVQTVENESSERDKRHVHAIR